jgi:hypothetical protein
MLGGRSTTVSESRSRQRGDPVTDDFGDDQPEPLLSSER